MFRSLLLLATIVAVSSVQELPLAAQTKTLPKGKKVEAVAGFTKQKIAGFTVHLHNDLAEGEKKSKVKAADALEKELTNIAKMMPKKYVDVLQANVPVWVNWHTEESLSNGRVGAAAGYYTGVYPRPIRVDGKEVYVSGIRILMMDEICRAYESDAEADPSTLLLHEFNHAVHDLCLDFGNATIKDGFRQAMERKLYDNTLYMTTNEKEYFAELSCSYLLWLEHFPHHRDELKKHDPVSFKLLEGIWGKKTDPVRTSGRKSEFDLTKIEPGKFKYGEQVWGDKIDPLAVKDRPLVLYFWSPRVEESLFGLLRLNLLYDELRDFGPVFVGCEGYPGFAASRSTSPAEITKLVRSRGVTFPIFQSGTSRAADDVRRLPHCIVFDQTGKCVFRGDSFAAENIIRATVNRALIQGSGKETFEPAVEAALRPIAGGESTPAALKRLIALALSSSGPANEEVRALLDSFVKHARGQLKEAQDKLKSDPLAAYPILDRLNMTFKGTKLGGQAQQMLSSIATNKAVGAEMRAKPMLEAIRKMDVTLTGKPRSFDPSLERFQEENSVLLQQLKEGIEKVKKFAPGTKALDEALFIGQKYYVDVK